MMDDYEALAHRAGLLLDRSGRKSLERIALAAPDAVERAAEAIAVPETWFFRGGEPFALLAEFAASAPRPLRVLSAPCSTGEEPYSIAITLLEAGLSRDEMEIDAVDISARALKAAARAVYRKASFRHPMPGLVEKYFRQTGEGFELDQRIAKLVRFRQANLLEPFGAAAPYHVIFCRNLLMYLHDEARRSLVGRMRALLEENGALFTGPSELALFLQASFVRIAHPRSFACRKSAARQDAPAIEIPARPPTRELPRLARPVSRSAAPPASSSAKPETPPRLEDARRLADQGRLEEAAVICRRLEPSAEAFCLLGLISQSSDRFDEAEECYRKALYLDPKHEDALVHMSLLRKSRGDADAGARFHRRARRAAQGGCE